MSNRITVWIILICLVGYFCPSILAETEEQYSETVYAEDDAPVEAPADDSGKKRAIWPWVAGAALIGGGAAAIIATSGGGGGDDSSAAPAAPAAGGSATCAEGDVLGTWYAETADDNGTGWWMTLKAGNMADFQRQTDLNDVDMSMFTTQNDVANGWALTNCLLIIHSPIGGQSGQGAVAGASVSVAGKNYSK